MEIQAVVSEGAVEALEVGVGFRGEGVGRVLSAVAEERGSLPKMISVDNGTEFTSRALDHWAYPSLPTYVRHGARKELE